MRGEENRRKTQNSKHTESRRLRRETGSKRKKRRDGEADRVKREKNTRRKGKYIGLKKEHDKVTWQNRVQGGHALQKRIREDGGEEEKSKKTRDEIL